MIDQNNQGLSMSRNNALDIVSTEYVVFLDSDDILPRDALRLLFETARRNNSDIVIGGMNNFTSKGFRPNYTTKYLKNIDKVSYKKYIHLLDFVHACGKLYSKKILASKRFIAGVKHEDNYFNLSLYLETDNISMIKKTVYSRRDREGGDKSITQSLNYSSFMDLLTNYEKALNEEQYDARIIKVLIRKVCNYIVKELNRAERKKATVKARDFFVKYISNCPCTMARKLLLNSYRIAYGSITKVVCVGDRRKNESSK